MKSIQIHDYFSSIFFKKIFFWRHSNIIDTSRICWRTQESKIDFSFAKFPVLSPFESRCTNEEWWSNVIDFDTLNWIKNRTSKRKSSDLGLMIVFHFSRWHRNDKSIFSLYIEENDYQRIIHKLFRWTMLCMKCHHRRNSPKVSIIICHHIWSFANDKHFVLALIHDVAFYSPQLFRWSFSTIVFFLNFIFSIDSGTKKW